MRHFSWCVVVLLCLYCTVCWSGWRQAVCSLSMPVYAPPFVYLKSEFFLLNAEFLCTALSLFFHVTLPHVMPISISLYHSLLWSCSHFSFNFCSLHFHAICISCHCFIDLFFFNVSTMISFISSISLSNLGLGHCLLPPVLRWVLMLLHKLLFHSTWLHCSKIFSPGSVQ